MSSNNPASGNIGLIGLGVMGENLALNMERQGLTVSVYNRSIDKIDLFLNDRGKGKKFLGAKDEASFVKSIERPRRIVLLVKAGDATDETINKLAAYLEPGDIIVDGGNSYYLDTVRRQQSLEAKELFLIGSGVSGGEEGALNGPSLMPGGDKGAYEKIRPVWEAIAAKVDGSPCVTYLGPGGAGHFVKMVHNGIEYGDMQLIAEIYDIIIKVLGCDAYETAKIFQSWNEGFLDSFLIEITAKVLSVKDPDTGKPLVDLIVDKAGQKGTGKWTVESAQELAVPIPTIDAALNARLLSSLKDERVVASKSITGPAASKYDGKPADLLGKLADALYASKICSYAQGMSLIKAGSDFYKWGINLAETARIWKGGCIIRAHLLERISAAFSKQPVLSNLLLDEELGGFITSKQNHLREVICLAQQFGVPVMALSNSLAYFDSYRSARLPQNLTQAQRDYFGAHTYERVDKPGFIHTEWESLLSK
jgi:6-phosphogluconate dehydrogenase